MQGLEAAKGTILVVDDEEGIRTQLKWALSDEYRVILAGDADKAMELLQKERPNLVALDITLSPYEGDMDGLEILQNIIRFDPTIKVIMITGNDKKDLALRSIQLGAHDFYQKPINIEEFKIIVKRALYIQKLELENRALFLKLQKERRFRDIIGNCPQMIEVYNIIKKVSTTDATVLIYGESGTGKELVARAIHYQSTRKDRPFITINCGAIPENLLESELFGHEKGSFTGAYFQKKGKLELANEGTIFLDEIGELTPALQVKILRFLQEREIERVGGKHPIQLDVRIIAATNRDLKQEIEKGTFRRDLYYRLSVITISLPPLRNRGDDILLLANSFLTQYSREYGKRIRGFTPEAIERMREYAWPGNVRELENKIKRAIIMAEGSLIYPEDLDLDLGEGTTRRSLKELVNELEEKCVREALKRNRGNISRAARELGINRPTFYELMHRFKINRKEYKL